MVYPIDSKPTSQKPWVPRLLLGLQPCRCSRLQACVDHCAVSEGWHHETCLNFSITGARRIPVIFFHSWAIEDSFPGLLKEVPPEGVDMLAWPKEPWRSPGVGSGAKQWWRVAWVHGFKESFESCQTPNQHVFISKSFFLSPQRNCSLVSFDTFLFLPYFVYYNSWSKKTHAETLLRSPSIETGIGWNWESLIPSSTLPVVCNHIDSFTALAATVCISHPDHYCHIQHLFSLHPHHVTMSSLTDLENLKAVS